jgi:hypothetical protein
MPAKRPQRLSAPFDQQVENLPPAWDQPKAYLVVAFRRDLYAGEHLHVNRQPFASMRPYFLSERSFLRCWPGETKIAQKVDVDLENVAAGLLLQEHGR